MDNNIKPEHTYSSLVCKFKTVDDTLTLRGNEFGTKRSKRVLRDYSYAPPVPQETDMTDLDIHRWNVYLDDMFVLVNDIRNDRELEALCLIFGEVKMDLYIARRGNNGRVVMY